MVVEEGPVSAVSGLNVDDIVTSVHRATLMYHYCFQEVVGARLLSLEWLAFLEIQGSWVCHMAGYFLSFRRYSVDLENECVFVAISL